MPNVLSKYCENSQGDRETTSTWNRSEDRRRRTERHALKDLCFGSPTESSTRFDRRRSESTIQTTAARTQNATSQNRSEDRRPRAERHALKNELFGSPTDSSTRFQRRRSESTIATTAQKSTSRKRKLTPSQKKNQRKQQKKNNAPPPPPPPVEGPPNERREPPGFSPLNLRTAPLEFEKIAVTPRPAKDGNGRIPYVTNQLRLRVLKGRNCISEALTFATGSDVGDLGLLKTDVDDARDGIRFSKDGGVSMGLIAAALVQANSPFSFRHCRELQDSWTLLFSECEGVFLVTCLTRPNNDATLDRHMAVYDAYRRLFMIKPDSHYPFSLRVTDEDCEDESKTKKYLEEEHGLVAPKHAHLLMVLEKRLDETKYASP